MNLPIIITLTTYPARISGVHLTIKSLLKQSIMPNLIILWLAESQFPNREKDLPAPLRDIVSEVFQIRWCDDLKSYKKLVPALEAFPSALLVTVDDDVVYERNLIAKLLEGYKLHPDSIICSRVTKFHHRSGFLYAETGGSSYWHKPSYLNKLVGCAGCLYPPGCLDSKVLDREAFMRLAPTSDDLWFWLMAVKYGTKVYRIPRGEWLPKPNHLNSGVTPLSAVNDSDEGYFYRHFDNILSEYPEIEKRLLVAERSLRAESSKEGQVRKILSFARRLPVLRQVYSAYLKRNNNRYANEKYLQRQIDKIYRGIDGSKSGENRWSQK